MQTVFLKVYHSGKLTLSRQFKSAPISIGSGSDGPSLVLADPSVCFWHALIEKFGGEYHISDLGSPTGTFVNSKPVLESSLQHGDVIKVGDFEVHFFTKVPFAKVSTPDSEETGTSSLKKTEVIPPAPKLSLKKTEEAAPAPEKKEEIPPAPKVSVKKTKANTPAPEKTEAETPAPEIKPKISAKNKKPSNKIQNKKIEQAAEAEQVVEKPKVVASKEAENKEAEEKINNTSSVSTTGDQSKSTYAGIRQLSKEEMKELSFPTQEKGHAVVTNTATFAPPSEIKDLDSSLPVGSGPIVEVLVCWKERILSVHHFSSDSQTVTFGSSPQSDIVCPNLIGQESYELLTIGNSQAAILLSSGVKVSLIDKKAKKHSFEDLVNKGVIVNQSASQACPLNQNQLARLDFSDSLRVYIRYANRAQKAIPAGVFGLNFSESVGLMMFFVFMSSLFFYLTIYSPSMLDDEEDLDSENLKKASIEFKPKRRVVKLKVSKQVQKRKKLVIPQKKKKVVKRIKKRGIKKKGSAGRIGQVAAKPKVKSKKKTVTSARPGGSVTTKKSGAGARSPRPDPNKVGLLGVFGTKGAQKQLDKAYSGSGELAGLAEQATGSAGQKDSYEGEGIGTKFKNVGAGGKGSALIGVSEGIQTKGRGGGQKGYGRGGSLGQRGNVQLALGTDDWEVGGGVDKNAILRVIRRNKSQLEQCYELALQKKPDLEGKVWIQWDIVNESVRNVKTIDNSAKDRSLAQCLMSRLRRFRFTGTGLKSGQVGEVNIPFVVTKK